MARGKPHLRVENRVLPAGPTVVDVLANAAFYYGCVKAMMEDPDPVWGHLSFEDAEQNLHNAARTGLAAELVWRRDRFGGPVPVRELVVSELLPLARRGLDALGIDPHDRDEFLGIIEGRCVTGRNGATWLSGQFHRLVGRGPGPRRGAGAPDDRVLGPDALRRARAHLDAGLSPRPGRGAVGPYPGRSSRLSPWSGAC